MIWKATIKTANTTYSNINIIPEISYSDVMDGTADTITFSFIYDEDIVKNIKLKDLCEINVSSDEYNKTYYMCISQISSEKMSTKFNNGYMITVSVKEETILLKDCVRTDIAITPSLYPQLETKDENDKVTKYNIYSTLYDALLKIIDCHNAVILNHQITDIDEELIYDLSNVACPNLTYRDLSTYSQLYDVLIRVGRMPYLSNGKLYGIKLTGNSKKEIRDISKYSNISTLKQTGINDNVYSTKIYNNIYDDEFVVVPQIFTDMVYGKEANKSDLEIFANSATTEIYGGTTQTYADAEIEINNFINSYYSTWTNLNGNSFKDVSKTLLFVNGFNQESAGIEDARSYFLELPYNIELVDSIYACYPYATPKITQNGSLYTFFVSCGFRLSQLETENIIENTMYENLSSLQKRTKAYYVRGSNKINNIICLLDIKDEDLTGDYAWSNIELYNKLRSVFYVVKLKPILNTCYTNYSSLLDKSINNMSLPYSQVSDKQVYPILDYNVKKGSGDIINVGLVTDDISLLEIEAGDLVYYQGDKYLVTTISFIINNKTIEINLSLTKNIVTNSLLSSYKDTVRISSILSSESLVDRNVHLFVDHTLSLSETPTSAIGGNLFFDFGNALRLNSIYNNGFSEGEITYPEISSNASINIINRWNRILSNYAVVLNPIIPYDVDLEIDNNKLLICIPTYLQTRDFPGQNHETILEINPETDFPITLYVGNGNSSDIRQDVNNFVPGTAVICNDIRELKLAIPTFNYLAFTSAIFGDNDNGNIFAYKYMGVLKNSDRYPQYYIGEDVIALRGHYHYKEWPSVNWLFGDYLPSLEEIISNKSLDYPTTTYLVYDSSSFNTNKTLITERLISSSGLLTKVEYCVPSPYYSLSATYGEKITGNTYSNSITIPSEYSGGDLKVSVNSYVPILYNTTENGCRLVGIGNYASPNEDERGYAFTFLPNQFGKGQYLDIRENIRPYIQFKTKPSSFNLYHNMFITDINPEFKWLDINRTYKRTEYDGIKIFKIDKYLPCNSFIDYSDNNLISEGTIVKNTNSDELSNKFELSSPINKNDNYEYILCLYKTVEGEEQYTNLIKFKIEGDNSISTICINSQFEINYDL